MTLQMPSRNFGVSRYGHPIHELPASGSAPTGITYRIQFPGCVAWFEEYEAMIQANYSTLDWAELSPFERADAVAQYRLSQHIALHQSEAMDMYLKRKQARFRHRGKR